jgi:hypothetical protein
MPIFLNTFAAILYVAKTERRTQLDRTGIVFTDQGTVARNVNKTLHDETETLDHASRRDVLKNVLRPSRDVRDRDFIPGI